MHAVDQHFTAVHRRGQIAVLSRCRGRNAQDLFLANHGAAAHLVGRLDCSDRHAEVLGDPGERVAPAHLVPRIEHSLADRDLGQSQPRGRTGSQRHSQIGRSVRGRLVPAQGRIEVLQGGHVGAGAASQDAQIRPAFDYHRVVADLGQRFVAQAVLFGLLGEQGRREDRRHVVLRLAPQVARPGQFPEVTLAGASDGLANRPLPRVVGREGQVPVAELVVELFHVRRCRTGRQFGIGSFVDPVVDA